MNKKKIIKIILYIIFFLIIALSLFLLFFPREEGDKVIVTVDGSFFAEYPLSLDRVVSLNNGNNVLEIKGGKVRMESALCPDKICVKEGWKMNSGDCITCLPFKTVLTVVKSESEVDLVL